MIRIHLEPGSPAVLHIRLGFRALAAVHLSLPLWHHSAHLLRGQWVNCPCFPVFTSPLLYTFRRKVGGGGKFISRTFFFPKLLPLPPLTVHTVGSFYLAIHSDPLYAHFWGGMKMIFIQYSAPILNFPGRKQKKCGIHGGAWVPLPACCHLRHTWPWSLGCVRDRLWVSQIPWIIARCKPRPSRRQISHKIIVCVRDSRAVYLANGFEFNSLTRLNSFHVNWQAVDQDNLGSLNSCSLKRRQPAWE